MIFIDNKYTHWYYSIISNALSRQSLSYTEKHHIIPKSLGGDNSLSNLVRLTPKEHFVCHRLLTKMVLEETAKIKMHNAVFQMSVSSSTQQRYKINSTTYEILKKNKSSAMKGNTFGAKPMSEETKRKISEFGFRVLFDWGLGFYLLQTLVGVVDAKLLEAVRLKRLEPDKT